MVTCDALRYQELKDPGGAQATILRYGCIAWGSHLCRLYKEALNISREVGEPRRLGSVLELIAYFELTNGNLDTGTLLMHEAAEAFQAAGDLGAKASAELHLSFTLGWMGEFNEACKRNLSCLHYRK
jgi:hypothetical protein